MEENLAAKLCLLLHEQKATEAVQWKLLGQEKDGSLLLGWIENESSCSVIGCYDRSRETLKVLYRFSKVLSLIQATVNQSHSVLGYVIKQKIDKSNEIKSESEKLSIDDSSETKDEESSNSDLEYYQAYVIEFDVKIPTIYKLKSEKLKQIRIQFLYKERTSRVLDKLLVLVHRECIDMYTILYSKKDSDRVVDYMSLTYTIKTLKVEKLVKNFIWAQWDAPSQVLYYIHHRRAATNIFTEDVAEKLHKPPCTSPTLSGLQFHENLPHETVINIPLNLPQSPNSDNCGTYEDDVIPLRVHDCSLDLIIVSDYKSAICICHHYLYRPVQPPQHISESALSDFNTVHFAYSVTILHNSYVVHCVVPGIPWVRAKLMRPTFTLLGDSHMVIFVQDFFTHLLKIKFQHKVHSHIVCGPLTNIPSHSSYLVPLLNLNDISECRVNGKISNSLSDSINNVLMINLPTLDLVNLSVPKDFLVDAFKKGTSIDVRLGILHYFLCEKRDMETAINLISTIFEKPRSLNVIKIMKEFLIGGAYCVTPEKNLTLRRLLSLLPLTTLEDCSDFEVKINDLTVNLSHEKLWNTSVMLLSPRQRLVPQRKDFWITLWDLLNTKSDDLPRFKPSHVSEKLLVSLACYQPEALSQCSTPMSPSGSGSMRTSTLDEIMKPHERRDIVLPFSEMESCTASTQEHIVSVNLRELTMHLQKYGSEYIHDPYLTTLAVKYVKGQLEMSRLLCSVICRLVNIDARVKSDRDFSLIDNLEYSKRWLLFTLLERYRNATENIAFPVPRGFMSFFTYLGYRTLKYSMFLQYVQHSVFELQVDVAKAIIVDIGDSNQSVTRKLELLSLLPRTRGKRLLNQWLHPMSYMLAAREHAANILSGEVCQPRNRHQQHRYFHKVGLPAFSSESRLSPLDTFLNLLTAKASLTELDFGLLIEATVKSIDDPLQCD